MKNAKYWRGRFSVLEDFAHREAEQAIRDIEEMFMDAQRSVQKEIEAWYQRFAKNNQISLADARKLLTTGQLEEFKWSVEKYIKAGQLAGADAAWLKKLENASARVHVSRLEAIQMEIQQQLELLYGNQVDELDGLLKKVVGNGYTHTAYEVHKGLGLGWDMTGLDQRKLETLLSKPWTTDGRTFRDRCWVQKAELVDAVQKQLVQGMLRGDSPEKAIKAIQKQFGVSRYKAARLVHTETSYFNACSTFQSYVDLDVERVEILGTLDSRTCDLCGELDGKVISLTQYEPGVTVPPFHPNCRCTTCPYYADMDGERAARNAEGEVYYLPANMTYADWKKAFVDGGSKDGLTVAAVGAIIKGKRELEALKAEMFPEYLTDKKELKNTQALIDYVNRCKNADPDVVALYSQMGAMENIRANGIPMTISHASNHAVQTSYYRTSGNLAEVKLTIPKLTGDDLTGQVITTLHEEMHLMDLYCRPDITKPGMFSATNQKLRSAFQTPKTDIPKVFDDLFEAFDKECDRIRSELISARNVTIQAYTDQYYARALSYADYKKLKSDAIKKAEAAIDYQCRNAMGGGISSLEDIYDALSGGTAREAGLVRYGHGASYYRDVASRCEETLANYGALAIARPDLMDMLRQEEPELVEALNELVQEMLKKGGV